MKILIVMDPGIMIPVKGYGGHERLVEMFAKEYYRRGHEVHLLITSGSFVEGCTVHGFGKEGFPPKRIDARKAIPVAWKFLWKHRSYFDVVHNFGRLAYLLPILFHPVKKIMTYGRRINPKNIKVMSRLKGKNIFFTGCSQSLLSKVQSFGHWQVVYNAIEFDKYYPVKEISSQAPLIFLGRIERVKGCHTAIEIAKATGNNLIIAGNISPLEKEQVYFKKEIEPHIDGTRIKYVGQVNDAQKSQWLGQAKALIFPIAWEEPFGIVMIEAMACGTPVVAFKRGSVNEVIDEGITGYKVDDNDAMITALKNINSIDRDRCRQHAKMRFDVRTIANTYLEIIGEAAKKILIITTSNPSANPRMIKEYSMLKNMGCAVKVLYSYNAAWSYKIDEANFKNGTLHKPDFLLVGGNPFTEGIQYFISRVMFKIFRNAIAVSPFLFLRKMASFRSAVYLRATAVKYKADLYIAHYIGALPAAISAAKKYNGLVIFDAEDFHRGEDEHPLQIKNIIALENKLFPLVDVITTASPLISDSYQKLFPPKKIYTVNNFFSRQFLQPAGNDNSQKKLRLFWFSQNIGPYRGLEIFIQALNYLQDCEIDLTILGNILSVKFKNKLIALADDPSRITFEDTISPEKIFARSSAFDIGLAGEIPYHINKEICLSNKIFTYLMAGNCIIVSDTAGQKHFMETYPGIGLLYKYNDACDLARKIKMLYDDRSLLKEYKKNALMISSTILNWEEESKKLKEIICALDKKILEGNCIRISPAKMACFY